MRRLGKKSQGIGPGEGRVGIGEKLADVSGASARKNGVGDGMREHVGIGMSREPALVRDVDAADDELAAFGEGMHVVADADPHAECRLGGFHAAHLLT